MYVCMCIYIYIIVYAHVFIHIRIYVNSNDVQINISIRGCPEWQGGSSAKKIKFIEHHLIYQKKKLTKSKLDNTLPTFGELFQTWAYLGPTVCPCPGQAPMGTQPRTSNLDPILLSRIQNQLVLLAQGKFASIFNFVSTVNLNFVPTVIFVLFVNFSLYSLLFCWFWRLPFGWFSVGSVGGLL